MNCPTCGSPIGAGTLICPSCGTQLAPGTGTVHRGTPAGSGNYPGSAPLAPPGPVMGTVDRLGPKQTSGLAVASLIAGIASWIALPIIGSIAAIILGHMARAEIRKAQGRLEGDGMALGGLITGYGSLVLGCLVIPCIITVFFGGLAALLGAGGFDVPPQ